MLEFVNYLQTRVKITPPVFGITSGEVMIANCYVKNINITKIHFFSFVLHLH